MKTVTFISKTGYKFYLNATKEQMIKISELIRGLGELDFYDAITIDMSKEVTDVFPEPGAEAEKN